MRTVNGSLTSTGEDRATALHVAAQYIANRLGPDYGIHSIEQAPGYWWMRIECRHEVFATPVVVGTVRVNVGTGEVVPLPLDEIDDIRERALVMAAHQRGELARGPNGYLLPYQAKIKANAYLADNVAFFASTEGRPEWVEGEPPFWRFATALRLREHGKVCDLGTIDVNAITGEVTPLSNDEITIRQRRAQDAVERIERSAAKTG